MEIRCSSRGRTGRCNGFVTREPEGYRYLVQRQVANTAEARACNHVFQCKQCGVFHEVVIVPLNGLDFDQSA